MHVSDMIDTPPDATAVAIRTGISKVETALTEFDKISAGLADLHERYPANLVYDCTTSKGMSDAVTHRAAWRDPRIAVERCRTNAKAPVLALGRDIDARAKWLTAQLEAGELPIHEQIKAEERRKSDERVAREAAEFARVQAIQEALADIHEDVMVCAGKSAAVIAIAHRAMFDRVLDARVFQEQMPQAKAAQAAAIAKLDMMHKARLFEEAEAAKVKDARDAEAAERDRQRVEQARVAKEQAKVAAEQAEERRKIAAERAELEAARKAEADRIDAAEQAERAQDMHGALSLIMSVITGANLGHFPEVQPVITIGSGLRRDGDDLRNAASTIADADCADHAARSNLTLGEAAREVLELRAEITLAIGKLDMMDLLRVLNFIDFDLGD